MKKALQTCCATLIILILSFPVTALSDKRVDFIAMDHEIYLDPWLAYQKIIGLQSESENYDEVDYLWWLLRKAQTENLVYFYDDFSESVKQANKLVTLTTPLVIQARLSVFQGLIEQREGSYSDSQATLAKALLQAKEAKLSSLYVYIKQELAYTKTLTELFDASLVDIQEAYVEAFALKDQYLIASINETYGAIYGYLDDYEKSIEYYQMALESYQSMGYPAHVAEALYGLASTYRYWGKYDLAIAYFEQYQQKTTYTPNANISFFSAYGIGMTLAEKGNCFDAVTIIDKALALKGIVDYNAELYKRKASCLIVLGRLDEAKVALTNASAIFANIAELRGTKWQLEVKKVSAELAHAQGQYDLGFAMLAQYYDESTELLLKKSAQRLLKIKTGLEMERLTIYQALEEKYAQVETLELEKRQNSSTQNLYFSLFILSVALIAFIVIAAQYQSNRRVHALTAKDALSGLFNRRYIFDYLNKSVLASDPDKAQLSILLIDIDDFRQINDRYGHLVGDNVIREVAKIGLEVLRQDDVYARIDGKAFLCVLPKTTIIEAKNIAGQFLVLMNKLTTNRDHQGIVTVSIGVAALSSQCEDSKQLYINAQQALQQAKHLGKNQVSIF